MHLSIALVSEQSRYLERNLAVARPSSVTVSNPPTSDSSKLSTTRSTFTPSKISLTIGLLPLLRLPFSSYADLLFRLARLARRVSPSIVAHLGALTAAQQVAAMGQAGLLAGPSSVRREGVVKGLGVPTAAMAVILAASRSRLRETVVETTWTVPVLAFYGESHSSAVPLEFSARVTVLAPVPEPVQTREPVRPPEPIPTSSAAVSASTSISPTDAPSTPSTDPPSNSSRRSARRRRRSRPRASPEPSPHHHVEPTDYSTSMSVLTPFLVPSLASTTTESPSPNGSSISRAESSPSPVAANAPPELNETPHSASAETKPVRGHRRRRPRPHKSPEPSHHYLVEPTDHSTIRPTKHAQTPLEALLTDPASSTITHPLIPTTLSRLLHSSSTFPLPARDMAILALALLASGRLGDASFVVERAMPWKRKEGSNSVTSSSVAVGRHSPAYSDGDSGFVESDGGDGALDESVEASLETPQDMEVGADVARVVRLPTWATSNPKDTNLINAVAAVVATRMRKWEDAAERVVEALGGEVQLAWSDTKEAVSLFSDDDLVAVLAGNADNLLDATATVILDSCGKLPPDLAANLVLALLPRATADGPAPALKTALAKYTTSQLSYALPAGILLSLAANRKLGSALCLFVGATCLESALERASRHFSDKSAEPHLAVRLLAAADAGAFGPARASAKAWAKPVVAWARMKEFTAAAKCWTTMKERADAWEFTAAVEAACRGLSKTNPAMCIQHLQRMVDLGYVRERTLGVVGEGLVSGLGEDGLAAIERTMEQTNLKWSPVILCGVVAGFASRRDMKSIRLVIARAMTGGLTPGELERNVAVRNGVASGLRKSGNPQHALNTLSAIIGIHKRDSSDPANADSVFSLNHYGKRSDLSTYHTACCCLLDMDNPERVIDLLSLIHQTDHRWTPYTISILANAWAATGHHANAVSIIEDAVRAGRTDSFLVRHMMFLASDATPEPLSEACQDGMKWLSERGLEDEGGPMAFHFLMRCIARLGDVEGTRKQLDKMVAAGFPVDKVATHNMMLACYVAALRARDVSDQQFFRDEGLRWFKVFQTLSNESDSTGVRRIQSREGQMRDSWTLGGRLNSFVVTAYGLNRWANFGKIHSRRIPSDGDNTTRLYVNM
ncbi:hypothetical protein HDU93_003537 [Gonapodya sp. JEL0774]|nr:hypothetical protein HDU93_003537 [Gonapodya sp. JEL0774]